MNQTLPAGHLALTDVVEQLHASYRQVDYWVRQGWIGATGKDCGSGNHRSIDSHELVALIAMDWLVEFGLPPARAAALAHEFEANPLGEHTEGPITLAMNWAAIAVTDQPITTTPTTDFRPGRDRDRATHEDTEVDLDVRAGTPTAVSA